MAPPPTDKLADQIREILEAASWAIQYNKAINLYAGYPISRSEAVRKFDTHTLATDCMQFIVAKACYIEAKRNLGQVAEQPDGYVLCSLKGTT